MEKFQINPFSTDNTLLAFALRSSGVPWQDPSNPCFNVYSVEALQKYGLSSIEDAVKKGVPGKVTYFLERVPNLDALLKAFDSQTANTEAVQNDEDPSVIIDVLPEDMIRIIAHVQKNYTAFKSLWKKVPPKLMVNNPGKIKKTKLADGRIRMSSPGARIVGKDASKETLSRLKIK